MLAAQALAQLEGRLASLSADLTRRCENPGQPAVVEAAAKEAERTFEGYTKMQPNKRAVYECVLELLQGRKLSPWQQDLVAFGLTEPIREVDNATVLSSPRLEGLLLAYERLAKSKDFWPLSWHALLTTYFSYDPQSSKDEPSKSGWKRLQKFLQDTWPSVNQALGDQLVPDWATVLRREPSVLAYDPANKYADAFLNGDQEPANRLARDLGIPDSSWFWHSLILSAVQRAAELPDDKFIALIPHIIKLLKSRAAFRDEAIECLLVRYHACKGVPPHEVLKNFVISADVWKNPKLKLIGQGGAAWNRVPEPVWRMVLNWVNQGNLRDFFEILAARNQADAGRLAFWSRYMDQIVWARLIFGQETWDLQNSNPEVRQLIAGEQGMHARLTSSQKRLADAFLMQLGSYLIVEFSKKPNACYVYKANELPFEPYAKEYDGGSPDLAVGPNGNFAARIVHRPESGWEIDAHSKLRALGIYPDIGKDGSAQTSAYSRSWERVSSELDLDEVKAVVRRFNGAVLRDERTKTGGRLWVSDSQNRQLLGKELQQLGFVWSDFRKAWYYLGI